PAPPDRADACRARDRTGAGARRAGPAVGSEERRRPRAAGHAPLLALLAPSGARSGGGGEAARGRRAGSSRRGADQPGASQRLEHAQPPGLPETRVRERQDRRAAGLRGRRLPQRGRPNRVAAVLARAGLADSARLLLVRSTAADDAKLDPERELLADAAFAYTLLGDRDQAIRLLQEQIAANPQHRVGLAKMSHWWWRSLRND